MIFSKICFVKMNIVTNVHETTAGAVKITPAHDRLDFEIGQRHKLRKLECVDPAGRLVVEEGCPLHRSLHGIKQFEARYKILNEIKDMQLYR